MDFSNQLRVAQSVAVVRQLPATVATIVSGMAMALTMQLEGGRIGLPEIAWQLAMGAIALATFARWRRLKDRPVPVTVSGRSIRRLALVSAAYGLLSAIGTFAWAHAAGPQVSIWVVGIMLSVPAYAAAAFYFIPIVVYTYSAPLFVVCLVMVASEWDVRAAQVALLLVSAHLLMCMFFVRRNCEHFVNMVKLDAEQTRLAEALRSQTRELRDAQARLLAQARRAGMAQVATNVLHNVGNVLTSVNVSAHVLTDRLGASRSARVGDLARLLEEIGPQALGAAGAKAALLPQYTRELATTLAQERDELLAELDRLRASVDHIKNVVALQQSYAGSGGLREELRVADLLEDALRVQADAIARAGVTVRRDFAPAPTVALDRTRVLQVLVNLVENAVHAMAQAGGERRLSLGVAHRGNLLEVSVADTGCGIAPENLRKVFAHGFTTKAEGHGFGLHSCAVAALEMGGELVAQSDGPGAGATFTLRLPLDPVDALADEARPEPLRVPAGMP